MASPTTGSVKTRGRIASLLEVGTGFHGEMTGRENIYLNGAILGMTKKEINNKIEEIIDFSGCARYIDTPVKRYSSGMTVRLAFAVAAFLEPDILIVDEVLAVGDAEFQKKAIGKMQDISSGEGRTVLFVSHNLSVIASLCGRTVVLENGDIKIFPSANVAIKYYHELGDRGTLPNPNIRLNIPKSMGPKIMECAILDYQNQLKETFDGGEKIRFKLLISPDKNTSVKFSIVCFIYDQSENLVAVSSSGKMNNIQYDSAICNSVLFELNSTPLVPGDYSMRIVLHIPGEDNFDDWNSCCLFSIIQHDILNTGFQFHSIWNPQLYAEFVWFP